MELIFKNAQVLTLNPALPRAETLVVRDGKVWSVGDRPPAPPVHKRERRIIDCRGKALLPGFIDPHFHLLAFAKSFVTLDLGTGNDIHSFGDLQRTLRDWSASRPAGTWIRARGYHEFDLAEKRHPTRRELDAAVPRHPLILTHRSGGAQILNSPALALLGITAETEEPPEGLIDRDLKTGEPTGLFYGMGDWLAQRLPLLATGQLEAGMRLADQALGAWGITALHDVSSRNDRSRWELFRDWGQRGLITPRVTMALGWEGFAAYREDPLLFSPTPRLRLGGVKLIVHETTGRLSPSPAELREKVSRIHRAGLPAILHAVEENAIEAACDAVAWAAARHPGPGPRHRIEHCSLCPPALARRIASLGIVVVTQPPFLYFNGDRYLQRVPKAQQSHLYPFRSLIREGVEIAGSSDGPVVPADPLIGIRAAVTRRTAGGAVLAPEERLAPGEALAMYTKGAARALGEEATQGMIAPGRPADLALLSAEPASVPPEESGVIAVEMTLVGGKILWEKGRETRRSIRHRLSCRSDRINA